MTEEMFNLPLEDYILTFDDGLVTPLNFIDKLIALDTPKIFFISTGIVCPEEDQDTSFIRCRDAHEKAFNNDYSNYMTWSQIKMINTFRNFYIGGHSHTHPKLWNIKSIRDRYNTIKSEVSNMKNSFTQHNINTDMYCYCYNYRDDILKGVLEKEGFVSFFGDERTPIESLMEPL